MLNAEQIALQSRLVQQMVAMREREMTTILERYTAIGTQSSLLAGFAITSLTALDPVGKKVDPVVTYLFFIFSLVCVLSCMHVIMCTMYICNWAPRLALRGPSGSLQRSFVATKSEKTQINAVFTLGVMSFAVQTVLAIWVMDDHDGLSPHAAYATALTTVVLVADLWYHKRIHSRFFGEGPLELPEAERHYTRAAQPAPLPRGGAAGGDGSINTSCGAGGGLQGGGSGRRGQGGGLRTRLLDGASGQAAVAAAGGGAQPAAADDRRGSGPATTQRRGSIPAGSGSSGGAAGGGGAGSGGGGGLDDIAVRDNTMAAVCAHPDIASQHESNVGRGCGYGHGQQHGGDDGMVGAHAAVPRAGVVLLNDFDLMGMLQVMIRRTRRTHQCTPHTPVHAARAAHTSARRTPHTPHAARRAAHAARRPTLARESRQGGVACPT